MPRLPLFWILDANKQPLEAADVYVWGKFFEDIDNRRVAYTEFEDGTHVSTVFLGLDQRFMGDGPPLLFESMVFGGPFDQEQARYSSWDDAETGHKAIVRRVKEARVREAMEKTNGPA